MCTRRAGAEKRRASLLAVALFFCFSAKMLSAKNDLRRVAVEKTKLVQQNNLLLLATYHLGP